MPQLSHSVLSHIRAGFPEGVPDAEAAALGAILQEQLGTEAAHDVLRRLAHKYTGVDEHPLLRPDAPDCAMVRVTVDRISGVGPWVEPIPLQAAGS